MARPRSTRPRPDSVRPLRPTLKSAVGKSVQDRVYDQLCDALICGRLQGGQTLQIRDLAETFHTSVMPVREALRRLVAEGALESSTQRPVRVPELSLPRLDDLYQARLLVEGHAAACAAEHVDDALLAALRDADAAFSAAIAANDVDAEIQANHHFHFTIYEAAKSPILTSMIRSLWLQSGPFGRLAVERHQPHQGKPRTQHHHEIMKALARGDATATRRELEADLSWAWRLLKETVTS